MIEIDVSFNCAPSAMPIVAILGTINWGSRAVPHAGVYMHGVPCTTTISESREIQLPFQGKGTTPPSRFPRTPCNRSSARSWFQEINMHATLLAQIP